MELSLKCSYHSCSMPGIVLMCLMLPILVSGSTAQEDPLCTDSYAEFESASVGSNDSGRDIRNQLYKAFYAPNQHLPYSVLVTYQLVLTNGTRVNPSSDPDCSSELWAWLSSPVLLAFDGTYLNQLLLFTLNYFMVLELPHVIVTTTIAPCPGNIGDFLREMTASVSFCTDMHEVQFEKNFGSSIHMHVCTYAHTYMHRCSQF